jgi:hypothetical protein
LGASRQQTLALVFFCLLSSLTVSNAQTSPNKNQLLPYDDADGYQVLSSIIDASTNKLKSDSVSIPNSFRRGFLGRSISVLRQHSCGISKRRRRPHKEAKTKLLLRQEFSIQKKYRLVALSRTTPVNAGNQSQMASASATFSVSAVGFIVHNGGTIGGSSTFHLLRKTSRGWQEDTEIPKCGRIY